MNTKFSKLVLVAAMSALGATTALAHDAARTEAKQILELKDGSTLYIFKDNKMAVENKFGNPESVKVGSVLETKDGQQVTLRSNEVARLSSLLIQGHTP